MTERLRIDALGRRGDGVAEAADGPLFVPYALPGETVLVADVQGHPDRRSLLQVEHESPDRIAPFCPHFGVCGGCAIQHLRPDLYQAWKRDLVVTALRQAGIDAQVEPLIDAHGEGRRRATFHARRGSHDILQVGFAALRAHRIIPIDHCPVLAPSMKGAIKAAWSIAETLGAQAKPLDIQATATMSGLDVDVRGSGKMSVDRATALVRVAEVHRLARLTRHGELIAQRDKPIVQIGPALVAVPPGGFLQATEEGEAVLGRLVVAHAAGAKNVADLFAGIGPFSLRLAMNARVIAYDNDVPALTALAVAAKATPGLKPVQVERRDLFRRPLDATELAAFDAIIFDPPRQGAEAQARSLSASGVPIIVAVSCNPATFARDARLLLNGGYRLQSVTPVDQFRHAAHVEIVAMFRRA